MPDRLTADDQLVLWSDDTWPQDIGALMFLDGSKLLDADGQLRMQAMREGIEGRLHLLPRLRQVLYFPGRGRGRPLWLDAPAFNLDEHVHVMAVPAPGDDRQVLDTVARMRRRRLQLSRPLWEMWFLTGITGGRVGLFIRLHHVMGDGMASVTSLGALLDTTPEADEGMPAPEWVPSPWPSSAALLVDNLQHIGHELAQMLVALTHPVRTVRGAVNAWPTLQGLLAAEPGPSTSLNRLLGPDRKLDLIRARLDPVHQAAQEHGATVNDVLLAVIAGGLRGLLMGRGEPVDGVSVPVYVPMSLRATNPTAGDHQGGNFISQIAVPVPLGDMDPASRLRRIVGETTKRKAMPHTPLGAMFGNRFISSIMIKFVAGRRVNVLSADLPGSRQPLYFCGARILEVFPLLNLIGNVSLGVGAMSYAGSLGMLVVSDADAYPDLDVFTDSARRDLEALLRVTQKRQVRFNTLEEE
ncbi:WS/DGAT/MGAT family acyltransferase [Arthrobacter sp. SLBN-112]|jgi:WS/DGAT/MGAT family acyltransferase|uniref:wax ester/triacylglycerol synthase domain-containing protein n=1 Tax=Arthrobacter sp. SLBN-112 TaxID=2768452 RepID=UPI00114F7338|nr:wax ester/triacylglycerol synthase domain-containing protein [Arthrobacter sp. SLBN-112]TQJ40760.1 WS/DGAT/MGAT family acyltransferase [Arthrobacter sp. SLBN-112]